MPIGFLTDAERERLDSFAPATAESASWRTSKCHGQYVSTDKINRAFPDAPGSTKSNHSLSPCPLWASPQTGDSPPSETGRGARGLWSR